MASLITCPHCGVRPKEEFTIRGDASPVRPAPEAKFAAWDAYVHLRDNRRGRMAEHWQHSGGCRRWLVVERDTFTHEVHAVVDAAIQPAREAGQRRLLAAKAELQPDLLPLPEGPLPGSRLAAAPLPGFFAPMEFLTAAEAEGAAPR